MQKMRHRVALEVPWRTLLEIAGAAAFVWCLLCLADMILVLLVAVILAVTLDPIVRWLERRKVPRDAAAALVGVVLLLVIGGFLWVTWSSLVEQARYAAAHFAETEQGLLKALPEWAQGAATSEAGQTTSYLQDFAARFGRSALWALALIVFGFVLTIYFLAEGERTYRWLLAFVPPKQRSPPTAIV